MINLEQELEADINWRLGEISALKTIPFRYSFLSKDKDLLIKYAIPAIYSLWEGFVVTSFQLYVRELNQLTLKSKEISLILLTHAIDNNEKLDLRRSLVQMKDKVEFVELLSQFIESPIHINPKIPTKSNVTFNTLNNILLRFGLATMPEKPFRKKLDKLLLFRNAISHGEKSLPTKVEHIEEFSNTVIDLMSETAIKISDGYRHKSFLSLTKKDSSYFI